jgi:hypothetical protein
MRPKNWLEYYNGRLGFGKHYNLISKLSKKNNGTVEGKNIANLAIYVMTQLSSHFRNLNETEECSVDLLHRHIGYKNGNLIWNARYKIPLMTPELFRESEWCKKKRAGSWKCE